MRIMISVCVCVCVFIGGRLDLYSFIKIDIICSRQDQIRNLLNCLNMTIVNLNRIYALSFILIQCSYGLIRATRPSSSRNLTVADMIDKTDPRYIAVQRIREIMTSFNTSQVVDGLTLADAMNMCDNALNIYSTLQDSYFRHRAGDDISKIRQLKEIIVTNMEGKCDLYVLRDRSPSLIARFSSSHILYGYIKKLNVEHATFCLRSFAIALSEAIDREIRPQKELLDNMEEFRQNYEAAQMIDTQSSSNRSFQFRSPSNRLLQNAVINYLQAKYSINLEPGETLNQHYFKFHKSWEKFMKDPKSGFCLPILRHLEPNFHDKLTYLSQMDLDLGNKMDTVTYNWLSILMICKRVKSLGKQNLYQHYLASNYDIDQLEQSLMETQSRRFSPRETQQVLEIIRELRNLSTESRESINVYQLLDARQVSQDKCTNSGLAMLIGLYRAYTAYPNLLIYLGEHIERQWAICKPIFENKLLHKYLQINLNQRNKITNLRHNIEQFLNPSSEIREVWQLTGQRKIGLFQRAMLDYVMQNIGCNFENVQELRQKIDSNLRSACQDVTNRLSHLHEQFEQLTQFENIFSDVTHSWMSAYVICDFYIQDSFDWDDIFGHLRSFAQNPTRRNSLTRQTSGFLFGKCARPQ